MSYSQLVYQSMSVPILCVFLSHHAGNFCWYELRKTSKLGAVLATLHISILECILAFLKGHTELAVLLSAV